MRQMLASHKDFAKRLDDLERRYDAQFKVVFNSIRELINAQPKASADLNKKKHKLGFGHD